jgi:hypothetical protein
MISSQGLAKDDWKRALREKLEATMTLTKLGLDYLRVTGPGTAFVIGKGNIGGQQAGSVTMKVIVRKDGRVEDAGGVGALIIARKDFRQFQPGERVYVRQVEVKDNEIWYYIHACDTMPVGNVGSTRHTRYKALLAFEFDKGYLKTADFGKVKERIDAVLQDEQQAKAASTRTIVLGQTTAEVEKILGKPETIISLGSKTIYIYKEMRVVFAGGKVADAQ